MKYVLCLIVIALLVAAPTQATSSKRRLVRLANMAAPTGSVQTQTVVTGDANAPPKVSAAPAAPLPQTGSPAAAQPKAQAQIPTSGAPAKVIDASSSNVQTQSPNAAASGANVKQADPNVISLGKDGVDASSPDLIVLDNKNELTHIEQKEAHEKFSDDGGCLNCVFDH